ncbi:hypothetical protein C2869_16410 [Saccharobesus litoralis]|uniref:Uncharacterized protein n=1 Tax=Saccharobesus litoralis TaxID=2172099 RepID=A0A2S0VUM4_9ALTE|nr:hypothetical protein [Saccharobesus litoralis]AWB67908.1 hypothetical protein C2869_16410 [Saccharobesus litoralis]
MKLGCYCLMTLVLIHFSLSAQQPLPAFQPSEQLFSRVDFPESGFSPILDLDTQKRQVSRQSKRWINKKALDGSIRLRVLSRHDMNFSDYQMKTKQFLNYTCATSDYQIIHKSNNKLTLFTQCHMAYGQQINTLHHIITGNDTVFAFERIFNQSVIPAIYSKWLDYVQALEVCSKSSSYCQQFDPL